VHKAQLLHACNVQLAPVLHRTHTEPHTLQNWYPRRCQPSNLSLSSSLPIPHQKYSRCYSTMQHK